MPDDPEVDHHPLKKRVEALEATVEEMTKVAAWRDARLTQIETLLKAYSAALNSLNGAVANPRATWDNCHHYRDPQLLRTGETGVYIGEPAQGVEIDNFLVYRPVTIAVPNVEDIPHP